LQDLKEFKEEKDIDKLFELCTYAVEQSMCLSIHGFTLKFVELAKEFALSEV